MDLTQLANPQAQPAPPPAGGVPGLVQQAPQARPAPTHAETVAALHRFHEIELASKRVLASPDVGRKNVRPMVMDMGADLIGKRVMSLSQFMQGIQNFPSGDDLLGQKKWLERLYQSNIQGQISVLHDHSQAPPEAADAAQWTPDSHADHMQALISKYPGR